MSDPLPKDGCPVESLVGQVADEFLRRQEQGEEPDVEEYAACYPHAAALLRKVLRAFQLLDHSAIYVLIAGTYTPVFALLLGGWRRVLFLALVWALAAAGVGCKWLLPWPPYGLAIGLYAGLGCVGLLPGAHLVRAAGARAMGWALLGGLVYLAGGVCEATRWPVLVPGVVGAHEVLHLCDMGGTSLHVFFVTRYLLPVRR
jgi:hemolysin III